MNIIESKDADRSAWDAYVNSAPGGLPQHFYGWRDVMSKTYGYDTHFLMAVEDGRVLGVMPLYIVRSFLVGASVSTMPGGLCADNAEIAHALITHGQEIARQANVKQFVIQDTRRAWDGNLQTTNHHVHWLVDVSEGVDACWRKLESETRREVRLARKNGLAVKIDRTGESLDDFYQILSRFTHQVGTPVFGYNFLAHVVEAFAGRFTIAIVSEEEKPIAGYFQLLKGNTVYGIWGAALYKQLHKYAAYLAYWEILNDTATHGYQFWDMGRSPAGSSASSFKNKWGGVSSPVYQQVAMIEKTPLTESVTARVQSDSTFRRFMQIWSRLPFPLVQFFGPTLRRHVPFA